MTVIKEMAKNRQERYKYETADASLYKVLQERALQHRKHPTQAEAALWEYLKGNRLGAKFRRQHLIGQYIPDFVCLPKQLIMRWMEVITSLETNSSLTNSEQLISNLLDIMLYDSQTKRCWQTHKTY